LSVFLFTIFVLIHLWLIKYFVIAFAYGHTSHWEDYISFSVIVLCYLPRNCDLLHKKMFVMLYWLMQSDLVVHRLNKHTQVTTLQQNQQISRIWGKIEENLPLGNFLLKIENNQHKMSAKLFLLSLNRKIGLQPRKQKD
jgi:hypothetical protein